jgi:hypothetical protein
LRYFLGRRIVQGDVAVYIDCQNIGSNQSIYDDKSLPLAERATRLLIDVCAALHAGLLDIFTDPKSKWDISAGAPILDDFVQAISEVRVVGTVETENSYQKASSVKNSSTAEAVIASTPSVKFGASDESTGSETSNIRLAAKGTETAWIDFNYLNQKVRALSDFVKPKRIWILIDEWSTIPSDLQPYLTDLLRRTIFTSQNVGYVERCAALFPTIRHEAETAEAQDHHRPGGWLGDGSADIGDCEAIASDAVSSRHEDRVRSQAGEIRPVS